ncbi:MAG: hypothetical protein J7L37_04265 [Thermococcus sp.]|nr:hypothetical protein [Thermococcus sp.]
MAVEREYSGSSIDSGDMERFAEELFRTAEVRAGADGTPYSLKVVYWDVLEARRGKLVERDCWDILAGELEKEVREWARTLQPSDEP